MSSDLVREVTVWLEDHWDPDLTVRDWWEQLGMAGWSTPTFPSEWYGRGITPSENIQVQRAIREFGALGPPGGLGLLLAGPTIISHGTDDQKRRYLPDIVCGRKGWCQLFSEPAAGSDLASLQTRATRDGGGWIINGQKVWSSTARTADLGMLVARTNADAPKHQGLTYFLLNMHQPGVEIRPLRELTGRSLFNEVFLTDVQVYDNEILGELGGGWAVTNTTLGLERAGVGAGNSGAAESAAAPGTVAGHLERRAGDVVARRRHRETLSVRPEPLIEAARRHHKAGDSITRQGIVRLFIENELGRIMALRERALRSAGREMPGAPNMAKLRMSEMFRLSRETGLAILGTRGMLHDYEQRREGDEYPDDAIVDLALWSPATSIYGGTDQVQRNILAERILGLPRESGADHSVPFRDLPKNT
jgi:alkylation response protein AidB-like acyl-CoA dehydrogenase